MDRTNRAGEPRLLFDNDLLSYLKSLEKASEKRPICVDSTNIQHLRCKVTINRPKQLLRQCSPKSTFPDGKILNELSSSTGHAAYCRRLVHSSFANYSCEEETRRWSLK